RLSLPNSMLLLLITDKGRLHGLPLICLCASAGGIGPLLCLHGSGSFFNISDNLAHSRNSDPAAVERVFDADNRRGDRCFHFASFKSQVAAFHFAVNELQPLTVAQGLCPNNFTVFK